MNIPKTAIEVRDHLNNVSITPPETLTRGLLTGLVISLVSWIIWSSHTSLSGFFGYLIIGTFLIFIFGLKNVPQISHAIITRFGQRILRDEFEAGEKSLLSEGWQWLFPFIYGATVVDTQERSVKVDDQEFVVPNPEGKKSGIVVKFTGAQANFRVWHPFLLLETGEEDVDDEIVSIINETIRSHVTNKLDKDGAKGEGVERVFSADVDKEILSALTDEQNNARWGVLPVSVATPGIAFATETAKNAFEALYIKQREQETELTEYDTVQSIADDLMSEKYGFDKDRAFEEANRITKNLRNSDVFITSRGTNATSDLAQSAVLHKIIKEEGDENE